MSTKYFQRSKKNFTSRGAVKRPSQERHNNDFLVLRRQKQRLFRLLATVVGSCWPFDNLERVQTGNRKYTKKSIISKTSLLASWRLYCKSILRTFSSEIPLKFELYSFITLDVSSCLRSNTHECFHKCIASNLKQFRISKTPLYAFWRLNLKSLLRTFWSEILTLSFHRCRCAVLFTS